MVSHKYHKTVAFPKHSKTTSDCVLTALIVTAKVLALIVSGERNVKSVLLILLHFNYS